MYMATMEKDTLFNKKICKVTIFNINCHLPQPREDLGDRKHTEYRGAEPELQRTKIMNQQT